MFNFKLKPTKQDIEKLKALHKEKALYQFVDFISMVFRLRSETILKIVKEIPIEEERLENGYYQYAYNGVPFYHIHFGSYPYQRQHLYLVEEFELLYAGRQYISERPMSRFHITVNEKEKKSIYPSFRGQSYVCTASSIEELRKAFRVRFQLDSKRKESSKVGV